MKKSMIVILVGALIAGSAYGNKYEIINKYNGDDMCEFITGIGKTSYSNLITNQRGKVESFSCNDWPYGAGPGVLYYTGNSGLSALAPNSQGIQPYLHNDKWQVGNFFYGEELHFDFPTNKWTKFDMHQKVVSSGGFKVKKIQNLGPVLHQGPNDKTVVCTLLDINFSPAGKAVYNYDPTTTEEYPYSADQASVVTNYGSKLYVYANLVARDGWSDNYMYTEMIDRIWGGNTPGSIVYSPDPLYPPQLGWHEPAPYHCSGCSYTTFDMDFTTTSEGTWKGLHRHQNNIDPNTHISELQTNEGTFSCSVY
jgi:hypothetical protein